MKSLKTACLALSFLLSTGYCTNALFTRNSIFELASSTANVKVYFIDVGQGDAIFIDTDAMDVLVDGGPPSCNIMGYLNYLNVTWIDLVVATHVHSDHVGGVISVLNSTIQVDAVMINNQTSTTATYQQFMSLAQTHQILIAKRGDSYSLANNTNFTVLNPTQPLSFSDENDNSIVFRLQVGETYSLFTGDSGADAEEQMLQTVANLKCDVLKVAHHGSRTSTTAPFLDAVSPTVAVISVGAGNTYGHPHNETIQRLIERNITVYSTECSGTIQINSDGASVQVQGSPTPIPEFSPPIVLLILIFVTVTVVGALKKRGKNIVKKRW